MPLLEAVTIEVGAAIAKSILKLWVKDSTLGEDVSSSLIDLLKTKTSDLFAQRKGERQFAEIGDKIGEALLPLFEAEGAHLDEGERNAVAQAVAETLNKSKLSSELLAERNLQPAQLVQHMLSVHPITTYYFGEAAAELYKRIIKESCTYIVDIASRLPSFTEHTFAEVLRREDQIIAKTDEILEELRMMREQLDPMVEAERFEIEYRQAVARNLGILQLVGADVSLVNRRYRLSVAYITLSVAQKSFPLHIVDTSSDSSRDEVGQDIVSVDTALAGSHRVFIRGPAGSGKTTLLQWVAVRAATRSFEGQLSDWNNNLPFYMRLRHWVQSDLPRPEAFPGLVAPAIADTMPKGWVHSVLKAGRGIVLVDGVDEIPASQREEVHTWLKDLMESYKETLFIITSRPHAIEEGWMDYEGLSDAELQPMELADIYSFIDHWHEAVRQELHTDEEKNELGPLAEHLKEQARQTSAIRNLAASPLLCAMLCALNRERRQQLPVNRIELYKACCSLLLERRDKERRVDLTDYPSLNYSQKQRLLEDLAYWMVQENLSEVAIAVVDERFTHKLSDMPGISHEVSGAQARRLLVDRAGIIREPVAGQIDFANTFQEFFAAQAAMNARDIGTLIANAHNDQWQELIILAAGLAHNQAECEQLVHGLIKRGDEEKERRPQLHLLAVSCLETAVELRPGTRAEVEKRLGQLVPPKNMVEAKALAAAGKLAVKHLAKKAKHHSAPISAACVRALAIIGGDAALDMLEGYAGDSREAMIDELLKAWDAFDKEVYARRVLSVTFRDRSDLHLERLSSIDGIQYFTDLTSLDLTGCSQLKDLTPLMGLMGLTSLNLSYCSQLKDLTPLNGLSSLIKLNLMGCTRLNQLSLTGLISLIELDLTGCTRLSQLSLTDLTSLTSLSLIGCAQLSQLSLTDLTSLTSLSLIGCAQLSQLSLTDLTSLTSLSLIGCAQLSQLSLTDLTSLTSLSLIGCAQLSDLTPLTSLTSLTSLDLSYCAQLSDLTPLTSLTGLTWLNLSYCAQLSDLIPLTSLTGLTSLDLSYCAQLSDLIPLTSLTGLTSLDLSYCAQLSDLTPLTSLTGLTSLSLIGWAHLSDLSVLVNLVGLRELRLSRNAVKLTIPQKINEKVRVYYF
jgi:Leucine-rich repeat (LRR) protein